MNVMVYSNEARFRALRAQINPHLLYNTLESMDALTLTALPLLIVYFIFQKQIVKGATFGATK